MRSGAIVLGTAAAILLVPALAGAAQVQTEPPVASLRTLPPRPKLPSDYVREVGILAASGGISRSTAVRRTRMLLSDVTGLPLYAFAGTKGRICFVVWRGGGFCGQLAATAPMLWLINGGNRKRGQAVVGVVSDRVVAVDVSIRGKVVRARVRHNAFVVPFRYRQSEKLSPPPVSVRPVLR